MDRPTPEPVTLLQPIQEPAHLRERDVLGPSAHFADDVMVLGFVGQVDHARTMSEMDVMKMAGEFQGFNGPIDRRLVDRFTQLRFSPGPQVGRGEMLVVRLRQHPTDGSSGRGYP